MRHLTSIVDGLLKVVITIVFSVLVACVVWQVWSRYVLGTPSTVTDEMARFLFMWIGLIGAAYTLGQRRHLAIDLITLHFHGAKKRAADLFIIAAIAAFAVLVMVYGGAQLVSRTLETGQVSPALRVPMGYVYGAIPFSGAVILYYCLLFLVDLLTGSGRGPNDRYDDDAAVGGPLD